MVLIWNWTISNRTIIEIDIWWYSVNSRMLMYTEYVYVHMCMCICLCIWICIKIRIWIHMCIHVHTHTQTICAYLCNNHLYFLCGTNHIDAQNSAFQAFALWFIFFTYVRPKKQILEVQPSSCYDSAEIRDLRTFRNAFWVGSESNCRNKCRRLLFRVLSSLLPPLFLDYFFFNLFPQDGNGTIARWKQWWSKALNCNFVSWSAWYWQDMILKSAGEMWQVQVAGLIRSVGWFFKTILLPAFWWSMLLSHKPWTLHWSPRLCTLHEYNVHDLSLSFSFSLSLNTLGWLVWEERSRADLSYCRGLMDLSGQRKTRTLWVGESMGTSLCERKHVWIIGWISMWLCKLI